MATLEIHVKTDITLTGLPQLLTPRLHMIRTTPGVQGGDLLQQLVVLWVDVVGHGDWGERASDHDAEGELPVGAAEAIALLDLLAEQQAGNEAGALAEADDALEAGHAAVVLHDLANDAVDARHLVPRRGFDVALARHKPPLDPPVERRTRRKHRQHPKPRRALDRRLREYEPELLRQVPDQPPRLDLEHCRVRAPTVEHQDPRQELPVVIVRRLAEIRGRRCP